MLLKVYKSAERSQLAGSLSHSMPNITLKYLVNSPPIPLFPSSAVVWAFFSGLQLLQFNLELVILGSGPVCISFEGRYFS